MPVLCGSKLHIPPTSNHLLATQQETYKISDLLTKNIGQFLLRKKIKKSGQWTISRKGTRQKGAIGLGRKNPKENWKGKPSDSPEIPDRRERSDITGFPSGKSNINN